MNDAKLVVERQHYSKAHAMQKKGSAVCIAAVYVNSILKDHAMRTTHLAEMCTKLRFMKSSNVIIGLFVDRVCVFFYILSLIKYSIMIFDTQKSIDCFVSAH